MARKQKKPKKPSGWGAFDALTRKLVSVPKEEVDRLESERPRRRKK